MLTSSPSPERALYAVQVGGRDPLEPARACVAVLEVLRPLTGALVLDLHTDRWSEHRAGARTGAHGPGAVLPFSLLDQQDWAVQELRELHAAGRLAQRSGRWPGGGARPREGAAVAPGAHRGHRPPGGAGARSRRPAAGAVR